MNVILNDTWREKLHTVVDHLVKVCPEMMSRKIFEANVQQAFTYAKTKDLSTVFSRILSVGSFEDTAYETLKKEGYDIVGIDPVVNMGLAEFFRQNHLSNHYDIIFSTSVIEHVEDDERFIDEICKLLKPEGYGIITCDFRDDWKNGEPKPGENTRLYTEYDLVERLNNILKANDCEMIGERNYSGIPDFCYGVYKYSFATYTFQKKK